MSGLQGTRRLLAAALVATAGLGWGPLHAQELPAPESAPLTLRRAISDALRRSPDLRQPDIAVQRAEIGERHASAQFGLKIVPSFGSSADPLGLTRHSFGATASKHLLTGTDVSVTTDWYQYGTVGGEARDAGYTFAISQPLSRGFWATSRADLVNARRAVESSSRALDQARQDLVVSVAAAYFEIFRQTHMVEAGRHARDRAGRLRDMSAARAGIGLATELDVLRADLLASQAEAALAAAQEALESAHDRLKVLLGRPLDAAIEISADALNEVEEIASDERDGLTTAPVTGPSPATIDRPPDAPPSRAPADDGGGLVARALASRLDVREAHERIDDARRALTVARWNLLPPVSLNVSYTRRGLGGSLFEPYQQFWNGWRVGVSASYAFDRAAEGAAAAQARLSLVGAEHAAAATDRQVTLEVRQAHRALQRASGSITIQRQAVSLAERQLRLAEARFERGLAGNSDVIDAEGSLLHAQTALTSARIERGLLLLALRRATGTLRPEEFGR